MYKSSVRVIASLYKVTTVDSLSLPLSLPISLSLYIYIYIYIYMCVCVCVCYKPINYKECRFHFYWKKFWTQAHTYFRIFTNVNSVFKKMVYSQDYIYSHPQTDCFVLSELFSVARHAGRSKPGIEPVQLYVRLCFRPLVHQADHVG